jgi:redox-sensing transcriptional repressor
MNRNCIIRLSRYKNALRRLKSLGFVKVFSDNLSDAIGVTSSQVRKDFSLFGIAGNKRGGYNIDELIERLNYILGKSETQKVILAGAGKIGTALMKYKGFEKEGIKIVAAFDIDPSKFYSDSSIPVLPMQDIKDFIKNNDIKIGIIAVPETAAQQVLNEMLGAGIKGILNFSPITFKPTETCEINNVSLVSELEKVIYFINVAEKTNNHNGK